MALYKKNFFSIFLIFRVVVYGLLVSNFGLLAKEGSFIIISVFTLATVLPSFMCLFRPFQGYGASEVYVFGNISFIFIAFADMFSQFSFISYTAAIKVIAILIIFDCLIMTIAYLIKQLVQLRRIKSIKQIFDGDMFHSIIVSGVNKSSIKMFDIIYHLSKTYTSLKPLRIVAPSTHLQYFAELCENFIVDNKGDRVVRCDFKCIDTLNYGFYNDWSLHAVRPDVVINLIKPEIVLLDVSKPIDRRFMAILKKNNLNYPSLRSDNLFLLIINPSLAAQIRSKETIK